MPYQTEKSSKPSFIDDIRQHLGMNQAQICRGLRISRQAYRGYHDRNTFPLGRITALIALAHKRGKKLSWSTIGKFAHKHFPTKRVVDQVREEEWREWL